MKGILRCLPVILLVLSLSANGIGAAKARPRPALDYHNNVLLITVDTLRADRLGCYGAETVETPNIDLLAAEGVLFSRAFAHNPMTLPSHTNILLGLTPLAHGVHNNIDFVVREEWTTLAEHLKASGYSTAAFIGGFPLDARFGLNQGFEVYDDDFKPNGSSKMAPGERQAAEVVSHAIAWIRKTEGPWFAWIHIYDPHTPYNPPISFKAAYKDRPYDGEVAYVDSALAPLFEVVGHSPTQERTIVVLTADHGESLGEHG
jgi:arylsulfatase A-like enzyme